MPICTQKPEGIFIPMPKMETGNKTDLIKQYFSKVRTAPAATLPDRSAAGPPPRGD